MSRNKRSESWLDRNFDRVMNVMFVVVFVGIVVIFVLAELLNFEGKL